MTVASFFLFLVMLFFSRTRLGAFNGFFNRTFLDPFWRRHLLVTLSHQPFLLRTDVDSPQEVFSSFVAINGVF